MSVSLLAVAAVAVGVLISRQRPVRVPTPNVVTAGKTKPIERSLDAIRAAGW